jgi:hypothetical protein
VQRGTDWFAEQSRTDEVSSEVDASALSFESTERVWGIPKAPDEVSAVAVGAGMTVGAYVDDTERPKLSDT